MNTTPLTEEQIEQRRNALKLFIELTAAELFVRGGLSIKGITVQDGVCEVEIGTDSLDDQGK